MTDDERDHVRKAAMAISDLLATTLMRDPRPDERLYVWERDALEWLAEQRRRDPDTSLNHWTGCRMRSYLAGRASPEADGAVPDTSP